MVPGVGCVVLSDLLEAVVLSVENVEGEVVLVDGQAVVLAVVVSEPSVVSVS